MAHGRGLRDVLGREHAQSRTAGTFGVLVRHFFNALFDNEALSSQADASANLGGLLGLLAVPGAFLIFLLLPLTLNGWGLVTFRYFFTSLSMLVMAFLVVFKWDSLFPDRRDYLILTPLPLSAFTLFTARMSALAMVLALFLADVSFFGVLLWPAIDNTDGSALRVMAAHTIAVTAAGLFGALAAAALQGVMIALLPSRLFRRVSAWVQTVFMAVLVMLLVLTPLLGHRLKPLAASRSSLLRYFPGCWFVGLYERLLPATRNTDLLEAGSIGVQALAYAAVLVLCTYLPAYRRHSRNVLQAPAPNPTGPGLIRTALDRTLNRFVLRDPAERAVFWFISQTITRSMKHRVFLATYAGFGAALAVISFFSGALGALRLPLTLSFVLVSGLRAAFNFPSELGANWAFQLSETAATAAYLRAMRKWILLCAVLPLFCTLLPFELYWFAWPAALFHAAFGITLSLLLIEIMFFDFRKVAFTCSYFPGKVNLVGLTVLYIIGFMAYSGAMARLEASLEHDAISAGVFFIAAGAAAVLLARWRDRASPDDERLAYEDSGDPAVRTLELAS
jgi:hypothetical protein